MSDLKCPKCDFSDHLEDDEYCEKCGTFLINFCSNSFCDNNQVYSERAKLRLFTEYCGSCGSESTFKAAGFFDK